ncbi:hypothetical protein PED39_05490 [Methanomassiliicoccales archaeon LGM-RCC1]|nr:hypothetical protein PED39_05490 [Methanomassiliicoccales archaeon LGM-RCC1]
MYSAASGYQNVQQNPGRIEAISMSLGTYIDDTAPDDITDIAGAFLPMSNIGQLIDANYGITYNEATFEGDGIATTGSCIAPPLTATAYPPEIGVWSAGISDSSGNIDFTIIITLSQEHTSALTIYTDGPSIAEGDVTFSLEGTDTVVQLDCGTNRATASGEYTYDEITIHITKIDDIFKHVRLVEVEFGDSISLSSRALGNQISYIEEMDPLWKGLPMAELDFDIINLSGDYDEDNPETLYTQLAIGNPINLYYLLSDNTRKYTIPMGRFVIGAKRTKGNFLSVTAYDTRWQLSNMYYAWALDTQEDLGTTLDSLFGQIGLAYLIDDDVYEIYPVSAYSFNDESSLLEDLQKVAQAYGLSILPNRKGTIEIGVGFSSDAYGNVLITSMFTWAETSQINRYNYIDIAYYDGLSSHYTMDLREDPATTSKQVFSVNNPLITTLAHATAVGSRIAANLYSTAVSVRMLADPAMDLNDDVGIYSKYNLVDGGETIYRPIKREIDFDGHLTERTIFIR